MASACIAIHRAFSPSLGSSKCCSFQDFSQNPSQFFSPKTLFSLKNQTSHSSIKIKLLKSSKIRALPVVYAAQSNFFKVIQTAYKVGRDGIEAGTNFVPDAVPRPVARIIVTIVTVTAALFVLKSFLSTVFFAFAVMGLSYLTFIALNKDEANKGSEGGTTSVDDSIEEARRIMEKYK